MPSVEGSATPTLTNQLTKPTNIFHWPSTYLEKNTLPGRFLLSNLAYVMSVLPAICNGYAVTLVERDTCDELSSNFEDF